jgi:hypothetical protein
LVVVLVLIVAAVVSSPAKRPVVLSCTVTASTPDIPLVSTLRVVSPVGRVTLRAPPLVGTVVAALRETYVVSPMSAERNDTLSRLTVFALPARSRT